MITCRLDLGKCVSGVADNFVNFKAKSIIHLVTRLNEISQKLELVLNDNLPEIDVYIKLSQLGVISTADSNALCNFVAAKSSGLLFRLHLEHDDSVSQDIVELLQIHLDWAFWRAIGAWHQKKSSSQFKFPLKHLLSILYPNGLPTPSLIIHRSHDLPIIQQAFPPELELKSERSWPSLAVLDRKLNEYKKYALDEHADLQKYRDNILSVLPSELIPSILACVGLVGLNHFCEQLSFFCLDDLQTLIQLFFSDAHKFEMLNLLTPRGMSYIKCCSAWPYNLVKHWLHWLKNSPDEEINFFEAVHCMDYFWQKIKHRHPKISSQTNYGHYNFKQRILEMLNFLDALSEESRKIQISFLFELDWDINPQGATPLQNYLSILQINHLAFISREMLLEPIQALPVSEPLRHPTLSACLQYIALHLQDKSDLGVDTLKQYLAHAGSTPPRVIYQVIAWCASVSTMISLTVFRELCDIVTGMSERDAETLMVNLFLIEKNHRLQSDDLKLLLQIANGEGEILTGLISLYRVWFRLQTPIFGNSWKIFIHFLYQYPSLSSLQNLFALSMKGAVQTQGFESFYLEALLICLIRDEEKTNIELISQITRQFANCAKNKQLDILAVISSYDFSKIQHLPLSPLADLLAENLDENDLEFLFNRYYPDSNFIFFKSAIDYQLVFSSIEDLINSVQESIQFFLSDTTIVPMLTIKSLLEEEVRTKLQDQNELLDQFLSDLQVLKTQKNDINLTSLFNHLKDFEVFFLDFINWKLRRIFGVPSWLLGGKLDNIPPLIHQLDSDLNADSTLKDLMDKVLNNHDIVKKTPIATHFQFEILRIMLTSADTPVLQRYLDTRLVIGIVRKLEDDIARSLSSSVVPVPKLIQLAKFLHQLPLNQLGLEDFFLRYVGIQKVIKSWLGLESYLRQMDIDPESAWDVLVAHQFHNGEAYAVAHWQIGITLLYQLIDWQSKQVITSHFPKLAFLESFFRAKEALKSVKLLNTCELKHLHWSKLIENLQHALVQHAHNPMFLSIIPKAVEHILIKGEDYNFEQGLEVFLGFSGNPELISRICQLMSHPQREIQHSVGNIFSLIGMMLSKNDKRPWPRLINKIFSFSDFDSHLLNIEDLLGWINQESDVYCWPELLAYDEEANLSDLLSIKQMMTNPEVIWVKVYEHLFKWPPEVSDVQYQQPLIHTSKKSTFSIIWDFIWGGKKSPAIENQPSVAVNPDESLIRSAWLLWAKAPYPNLKKLLRWLASEPRNIASELQDFDSFPLGRVNFYNHSFDDIQRWMDELEFYDSNFPSKTTLAQRLMGILELINQYLMLSRTQLIADFHELKQQAHHQNQQYQDKLISTIAAIYYKSTNRQPYPTQLLTILLTFEYPNRNLIFEVDTGEGKGITTALLAVLKTALRPNATVEVRTANRDLVKQDFYEKGHWQFFKLLDIEHAIIQQDSPLDCYREGGIYYTTQDDIIVFHENRRLAGYSDKLAIDILADEVDSLLLDQKSMINLANSKAESSEHPWIYFAINQFIDNHDRVTQPRQTFIQEYDKSLIPKLATHHDNNPRIHESMDLFQANLLVEQFANQLKQSLIDVNKDKIYRLIQIEKISQNQWRDWLLTALYAKTLRENQDYLVEALEIDGHTMHKVVPYINGEVKYGFELSLQMKSGLTQLLHARLHSESRPFMMEAESRVIAQLPALDFRDIHSFTGLSGSIGSLGELFDMIESTSANAIRIPRFYPTSLRNLPNVLVDDSQNLYNTLSTMVSSTANPLLIVTEKIEDASILYSALKALFPRRSIKLITGQESEKERRDWLHANESSVYAGSTLSITVSTLICGRGTDIVVKKPYYLEVKQVGILGPRNGVQIKGRTARVNALGSYQVIYSREIILRDWSFLTVNLPPLEVSTLSLWVEKIQDHLIYKNRQQRLHLRMKGWCQKHLFGNLTFCLTQTNLDEFQKQTYHLFVSKELESLSDKIAKDILNIDQYISGCAAIWEKVLIKFEMDGFKQPYSSLAIFNNSLLADTDGALRLVTQTLMIEDKQKPNAIRREILSAQDLSALRQALCDLVPKENVHANDEGLQWLDLIQRVRNWLFELPPLIYQTNQLLYLSWKQFNLKSNYAHWEDFYQTLLSAMQLYHQQNQQSIWRLSYWLPTLNPISGWLPLFNELNTRLNQLMCPEYSIEQIEAFKRILIGQFQVKRFTSPIQQEILDWWSNVLGFFTPQIEETVHLLQKNMRQFIEDANSTHLDSLIVQIKKAQTIFEEAEQWRSWNIIYWLFWKKRCQVWVNLAAELTNIIQPMRHHGEWYANQRQISKLQIDYRTYLLEQGQNMVALSQHSFWRAKTQSAEVTDTHLFEKSIGKKQLVHYQLKELGRIYPDESKQLYGMFYPNSDLGTEQDDRKTYSMLLSIVYAFANPSQSQSVQLHLAAKPMTVLIAELQRFSKRRELLVEWDENRTLLDSKV